MPANLTRKKIETLMQKMNNEILFGDNMMNFTQLKRQLSCMNKIII